MKEKQETPGWVPMVHVIRDREFTIAFGEFWDDRFGVVPFAGATKKNPTDHENVDRGARLAIGNAFRHLGRSILKKEYAAIHKQYGSKKLKKDCKCEKPKTPKEIEQYKIKEQMYSAGYEAGYHQALEDNEE